MGNRAEFLTDLVVQAHAAIHGRVKVEAKLKGMGTTIVMVVILPTPGRPRMWRISVTAAHIDSRSSTLTPLTRDHTLIETYMERGMLTEALARTHPERHVLTRALGMAAPPLPDIGSYPLAPQDLLVLCSDG